MEHDETIVSRLPRLDKHLDDFINLDIKETWGLNIETYVKLPIYFKQSLKVKSEEINILKAKLEKEAQNQLEDK